MEKSNPPIKPINMSVPAEIEYYNRLYDWAIQKITEIIGIEKEKMKNPCQTLNTIEPLNYTGRK